MYRLDFLDHMVVVIGAVLIIGLIIHRIWNQSKGSKP